MVAVDKAALRRMLLADRARRTTAEREAADAARTSALVDLAARAGARCVASYASVGTEPDTAALNAGLTTAGIRVLLPRPRPDGSLDLVADGERRPGPYGIPVPLGPAVHPRHADLWLVPALAVDRTGVRLGRGGGAYDRVLPADVPRIALVHEGEFVARLPVEPHDRRVTHVALPTGVVAVEVG